MNFFKNVFLLCFLITLFLFNFSYGQSVEEKPSAQIIERISKVISNFGSNLLSELYSKSKGNLLISPANIYHALLMVHLGAGGKTYNELNHVLGIPSRNYTKAAIHSKMGSFFEGIEASNQSSILMNLADAFFLQEGYPIKEEYKSLAKKYYNAKIENVNFKNTKDAVAKVNSWVSEKTRNRIQNIVDEDLDPDTIALILTTLYFNGTWHTTFSEGATIEGPFSTGEKTVQVPLMKVEGFFSYVNNESLKFESVNMLYKDSEYAMNIILPYTNQTIDNLLHGLKDSTIKEIMQPSKILNVHIKLPKVKFSCKNSLVTPLKNLGVEELFSALDTGANLTDLTDTRVKVSGILHGTEIEIQENGTTASAVTVVEIVQIKSLITSMDKIHFHVDRPFIIHIYNVRTSMELFKGIIHEPVIVNN